MFPQSIGKPRGFGPRGKAFSSAAISCSLSDTARLLRIPAGREMPVHGHNGTELTMVLRGAFLDDGRRYSPGDVEISDQATEHAPVADVGEDCICLVASDATLKFSGLLPRLAQKFFRI